MIVSCFSLQDVFSLWVFFFAGHCCKNTVIFTTETKGSVHLVRHWYSFFSNTTATCIYGCQCHIWGWSIQLFLSLSLSLSLSLCHTHTQYSIVMSSQSVIIWIFILSGMKVEISLFFVQRHYIQTHIGPNI